MSESQPYQLLADISAESKLRDYNPYQVPPDLELCLMHQQAKKMGIVKQQDLSGQICPCCKFPLSKTKLRLCSRVREYQSVGIGYEFFFIYVKFLILLLIVVFTINGIYDLESMVGRCRKDLKCYENYLYEDRLEVTDRDTQLLLNMGAVIFSCLYIGYMKVYFKILEREQEYKILPSHYALLVKNLPPKTDKAKITQYFEKYRLRRLDKAIKIEEIIYVFKINRLMRARQQVEREKVRVRSVESELEEVGDDMRKKIRLEQRRKKLKEKLDLQKAEVWQYMRQVQKQEYEDLRANKVIVIFKDRAVAKQVEREFSLNIFQEYLYQWCSGFTCCSKKRIQGHRIVAERVPEPLDINFQNLERGLMDKFLRRSFTNIFSLGLIFGSFVAIIALSKIQNRTSKDIALKTDALLLSLSLVSINVVVGIIITLLANFESRSSYTALNESLALKLSLVLFFNVSSVPLYLLVEPKIFNSRSGYSYSDLILNVIYMFLSNSLIAPLLLYFDPVYIFQRIRRLFIRCRGARSKTYQCDANQVFEEPDFAISEKYALANRTVLTAVFYSDILPYGTVVLLFGLILTYWISKYLFVHRSSLKYSIGTTLNRKMMNIIVFIPGIITGGFVLNNLQMNYVYTPAGWASLIVSLIFSGVSLFLSKFLKHLPFFRKRLVQKSGQRKKLLYEEVKNGFFPNFGHVAPFYQQVNLNRQINLNGDGDFKSMKHISLVDKPGKKEQSSSSGVDNIIQLKQNPDLLALYVDQVHEVEQRRKSLLRGA